MKSNYSIGDLVQVTYSGLEGIWEVLESVIMPDCNYGDPIYKVSKDGQKTFVSPQFMRPVYSSGF